MGTLERVASGVDDALAGEVFVVVVVADGVFVGCVGVVGPVVGVGGSRLAGVEINHRIKSKTMGIVVIDGGSGDPVLKVMKIILNGCISCE